MDPSYLHEDNIRRLQQLLDLRNLEEVARVAGAPREAMEKLAAAQHAVVLSLVHSSKNVFCDA